MRLTKKRYLKGFIVTVLLLLVIRLTFPQVARESSPHVELTETDSIPQHNPLSLQRNNHRILSVPNYKLAFPDSNEVQLAAAKQWGVRPVKNRADAEARMNELVYIAASPYYYVDPLRQSIPYLVPRAAVLLNDIGQAFYDSLYAKGIPLHSFIVTSVLRSEEDVDRLRRFNTNATENSCHLYGTTFDICYNRYKTVEDPTGPHRRVVRNDTLKYILSEVLRDMRQNKRCYIKYEVKQGCFHMTVR